MNNVTRTARLACIALSLGALLAACGTTRQELLPGLQPGPGGNAGRSSAITVTAGLEATRAASSSLPLSGGSISATASDGSRFTLNVPDGALTEPTTITMTPLSSLDGSPFSKGLVAGVKLEPDGLRFAIPVKLTIEADSMPPVSELVPFGFSADGKDFRHFTSEVSDQGASFDVMHFSGYGIAKATAGEREILNQSTPDDTEASLEHSVAEIWNAQQAAEKAGLPGDPDYMRKMEVAMLRYYQEEIQPDLAAARTSCYAAQNAIPRAKAWERTVELLFNTALFDAEIEAIHAGIEAAVNHCWEEMTQPCVLSADRAQVDVAVQLVRMANLLMPDPGKFSFENVKMCGWEGTVTVSEVLDESTTTDAGLTMAVNDKLATTYTIKTTTLEEMLDKHQNSIVTVKAEHQNNFSESQHSTSTVGCPKGLSITYQTVTYSHTRTGNSAGSMTSTGGGNVAAANGRLIISLYPGKAIQETSKIHLVESVSGTCNGQGDYSKDETMDLENEVIVTTADFDVPFDASSSTASGSETKDSVTSTGKITTTVQWNLTQLKKN